MTIDQRALGSVLASMPGWTPSAEASLARDLIEGRAKAPWLTSLEAPGHQLALVISGDPDPDDVAEYLEFIAVTYRKRAARRRAAADAQNGREGDGI